MSMSGPVFDPMNIMNSAVDQPESAIGKMVINAGVQAIQEAINPSPEQQAREEQARREEGERRQKEKETREAQERREIEEARVQADRIQALDVKKITPSTEKDVLAVLERAEEGTNSLIGDSTAAQFAANKEAAIQRMTGLSASQGTAIIDAPELEGRTPEIKLPGVVVRLQQDPSEDQFAGQEGVEVMTFERGPKIRELEDGSVLARVTLEYEDGTTTNMLLKFGPAEEQEEDLGSDLNLASERKRREDAQAGSGRLAA